MKKMISAFLIMNIFVSIFFACPIIAKEEASAPSATAAQPSIELTSKGATLIEASTGKVLFAKNADERMPIASVTKVMTMLLIMEAMDNNTFTLDTQISVSKEAAEMGGSQVYLEPGEIMSAHDMLKAIAVASGNDAAYAMAEYISGSEADFVSLMNARAKELGMKNTQFINCNGLDEDGKEGYSSAGDVAIMSRELLKHSKILEYTKIWMDSLRGGEFQLANTNKLIHSYSGATGLKTGSTTKAKYCLSASAVKDDMNLIAVVLGAETSDDRFDEAKKLLDYGFAGYTLVVPSIQNASVKVTKGEIEQLSLNAEGNGAAVIPKNQKNNIEEVISIPNKVKAPIKAGDLVGKIDYKSGDKIVASSDLTASKDVEKINFWQMIGKMIKRLVEFG